MLISPAPQTATNVASYTSTITPSGVEQGVVRADIPPVEESPKSAGSQNQQFAPAVPEQETPASASESPDEASAADQDQPQQSSTGAQDLTPEDLDLIDQLKARDREVRVHEAAHAAVGGRYAGSPTYDYTRGPDGRNYATGGEVSISTSEVAGNPQATIEKARVIQAAALAPAEPSAQDRRVAAEAAQMELSAQADLRELKAEEAAQAEAERVEAREKRAEEAALEEDAEPVEEAEPVATFTPVETSVEPTVAGADDEEAESDTATSTAEPRSNARQELEKILLGSTGLLQQANQQGLVDPLNPYGQSGFLDVIA